MSSWDIVTLDQAKRHLREDMTLTDHDEDITTKIEEAESIVMDYLKLQSLPDAWNSDLGSPSGTGVPPLVRSATLIVLGELYKNREAGADPLSEGVRYMLHRFRDPAFA